MSINKVLTTVFKPNYTPNFWSQTTTLKNESYLTQSIDKNRINLIRPAPQISIDRYIE